MIRTALLSVSDKNGIVPFAKALHEQGIKLISTGGTAKLLAENQLPVVEVSSLTKFPEMLDGRVKTLHPMVHGGLLARRDFPEHMAALKEHGIDTIDMLVINLYPFNETVAKENCSFEDAVENIDIGGPAMLRAAAKNHQDVTVLISPEDYAPVLAEMKANNNAVSYKTNLALAKKVFAHTAQYDGAIANYLSSLGDELDHKSRSAYPETLHLAFEKVQEMRYGENPHQSAAFYKDIYPVDGALANYKQLQGKELSYNNIADADSAWECVKSFSNNAGGAAACVIIKHANPCGVAVGANALEAYQKAFKTDPSSAFGGIIAFNVPCDGVAAEAISKQFVEVLPVQCPPVLITQHMPEGFTTRFAKRLDDCCSVRVKEAEHQELIQAGWVYIAPGHSHLTVHRRGDGRYETCLSDAPEVNRHRPSVDVLFHSAADEVGPNALAVLLTGMGKDGAVGMLRMREQGAMTWSQSPESCVVYGMPRAAFEMGASMAVGTPRDLAEKALTAARVKT